MRIPHTIRGAVLFAALTLLTACGVQQMVPSGPQGGPNNPYKIEIDFGTQSSCRVSSVTEVPTTCNGRHTDFCVGRNQWVQWESKPANIRYRIFFDTIQGGAPYRSRTSGILKKKIDDNAPYSLYKYTILRENCDPLTDAYDPHIRVDR